MRRLISVIVPSYNALSTLPLAIASLRAQTYSGWECIFVDDGSSDCSFEWISRIDDSRIRRFRNSVNKGRGATRQFALEQATGDYLCMLDADDWYYPRKLETQLAFMESNPRVDMAGAGMAVVDRNNRLTGVRRARLPRSHTEVTVAFPASIIRTEAARRIGFQTSWTVAEDREFLLRLQSDSASRGTLQGVIPEVLYGYAEFGSTTLRKVLDSHRALRGQSEAAGYRVDPLRYHAKALIYRTVFSLGMRELMIRARSSRPALAEVTQFESARTDVSTALAELLHRAPLAL